MVIKVEFKKELEHRFRATAMKKYGYSKGAITKASEEAIRGWVNSQEHEIVKVPDPLHLIENIFSHLKGKYSSVELQHEAMHAWLK